MGAKADNPVATNVDSRKILHSLLCKRGCTTTNPVKRPKMLIYEIGKITTKQQEKSFHTPSTSRFSANVAHSRTQYRSLR